MGKLELAEVLKGHVDRVWNASWHFKGTLLATCGEDKKINIWAKDFTGKWYLKTKLTEGHKRTIREISWSPCGNYLASASFDATVGVWDKKGGEWECNATLEGHENEVKSAAWAPSGQLLATCSRDKSVWIWEVSDGEFECAAVLNAHSQDVKKVRWHPELEILASASYDNTIKLFREDPADNDWTCFATLSSHESTVWSVAFNKTGSRLASVSDDKTLKIWQEYKPGNPQNVPTSNEDPTWKLTATITGFHTRTIYDIDWCKQTGAIVTACGDDAIRIFVETAESDPHAPTFELGAIMERAHSQDVNAVVWNPTEPGLLVSCGDDGLVKLWRYIE